MTIQYDFDARPMSPGQSRDFTLSSASPARVEVRCFVSSPPPPGYKGCAECGSYPIQQGQTIQIQASQQLFSRSDGGLDITVIDADGDTVWIQLRVTTEDPDSASVAVATTV